MNRRKVDSSMAISVGYDPDSSTLEIEFRSGEIWQYYEVPEIVYDEMTKGSIGKYFQKNIKQSYREMRIK